MLEIVALVVSGAHAVVHFASWLWGKMKAAEQAAAAELGKAEAAVKKVL